MPLTPGGPGLRLTSVKNQGAKFIHRAAALAALVFGTVQAQGQLLYFDTDGVTPQYGLYNGSSIQGSNWTATDGGVSATTDFATAGGTSNSTMVFTVATNSFTANNQNISISAPLSIGGIRWRLGTSQSTNGTIGLSGSTLAFTAGAVVEVENVTTAAVDLGLNNMAVSGDFVKTGIGNLGIRSTVTFSAPTTVTVSNGTLNIDNLTGTFNQPNLNVVLALGTTMNVSTATNVTTTLGALSGSGDLTFSGGNGGGTFRINQTNNTTFSGAMPDHPNAAGERSFIKDGTGTLTFTGTNTLEGTTTVQGGGTLLINGRHNSAGAYTVATNSTLGGTGAINLETNEVGITVQAGGRLAPGGDGTIEDLDLSLLTGVLDLTAIEPGDLLFDIGLTGDRINVLTGILSINTLEFTDFTFTEQAGLFATTYTLFTSTNLAGGLGGVTAGTIGFSWNGLLQLNGNNIELVVTAIPEPGTVMPALAGIAVLVPFARRGR